jgi:TolB-like protein/DNA-binding winged helix-turn-helix (wHTH) protein
MSALLNPKFSAREKSGAEAAVRSLKAAGKFLKICESRRMFKPASQFYEFGPFRVDAQKRLLLHEGEPVPLTPKAFDILLVMLARHGEALGKEELMQAVWPDVAVEENNLTRNISTLRKALGEKPNEHRYVVTIPGNGYRFVAAVRTTGAEAERHEDMARESTVAAETEQHGGTEREAAVPRVSSRRLLIPGVVVFALALALHYFGNRRAVTSISITSLAVLPLENLSGDQAQEYFADGMTDALIGDLAKIGALRVIPRTSAMRYKGNGKSLSQIARELKVDGIVEGTVQRFGDRVRIRARLVHVATEQHLWGETYERDLRDVLEVQSEVAQAVAREINIAVTPQEQARLIRVRQVRPDAYEAYLKARYIWNKRTKETLKAAVDHFERAINLDANYAPAYAGLADAYSMLSDYAVLPPGEAYPKARAAAQKALALDAGLAEAHTSLGWIKAAYEWNFEEAEREFQRAIALNRSYATARQWYAEFLSAQGRHQEAIAEFKRARQLEPFSLSVNAAMAGAYYFARQDEQAIAECRKVIELDSNFAQIYDWLRRAYENKGMAREALAAHQKHMELMGWDVEYLEEARRAGSGAGMQDYWRKRLTCEMRTSSPYPFWIAECWAQLGDKEQAFAWLEKLRQEHSYWAIYLNVVPTLDPLRGDPRFQNLLRRIGFPQ